MPTKPAHCNHISYPICGCQHPPVTVANVINIAEKSKQKEKAAKLTRSRGRQPNKPPKTDRQELIDRLPTIMDDPYLRQQLARAIMTETCRKDLATYCREAWHVVEPTTTLEWNWHHELICNIVQGLFEDWERSQDDKKFVQRVTQAVVNVPPGSLKSRILCVFFPTWAWLRRPGWRVICLSVNEDAAMRDARDSRTLIKSDWYQDTFQPEWQLKAEQDAISNYANSKGGVRLSRAQGSEIVGLRGDCLIVDDANNPKEAESKLVRDSVNDLYTTNIHNRVNHPTKSLRIGIQQRTHMDDWTGYIVKHYGVWTEADPDPNKWLHVVIPAEFEPERRCVTPWGKDPRTTKGQPLHDARMTKEWIAATRQQYGSQKYAGQYQQRPTAAEGGMVKVAWWRFFQYADQKLIADRKDRGPENIDLEHPTVVVGLTGSYVKYWDFDWTVISCDLAAKKTDRGSQHGILVVSGKGPRRFVRHDATFRGDILEVLATVKKLCAIYDPDRILIEDKAMGDDLATMFRSAFQSGDVRGSNGKPLTVVVEKINPGSQGKEARLDACLPEIEAGLVHLLEGAEWVEKFVGEVCGFPLSSHDDRVDAMSQCLNWARSQGTYQLPSW